MQWGKEKIKEKEQNVKGNKKRKESDVPMISKFHKGGKKVYIFFVHITTVLMGKRKKRL